MQKLSELVTLQVNTERIVLGEDNFYKGIYFVPGNAYLGVDLKKAKIATNSEQKILNVILPQPHAVVARFDLKNVERYDLSAKSWLNFERWFTGDKTKTAEGILKDAQGIIEKHCANDEYIDRARAQAEIVIKTLYSEYSALGWRLEIEWAQPAEKK